ncbi:hypothetical protein Anas_02152 [Armadillidium nasatum]|uniref:Uncharacterized protein n=1 Tax=Armadillidium nasatum TaxID=96803 RepID=A0A5N5SYX4_9CRUS|nr:hypothetical protein Anas_02152 [Armadillidium nasatum]
MKAIFSLHQLFKQNFFITFNNKYETFGLARINSNRNGILANNCQHFKANNPMFGFSIYLIASFIDIKIDLFIGNIILKRLILYKSVSSTYSSSSPVGVPGDAHARLRKSSSFGAER